jgi:L-serine dehydratase
MTVATYPEFFNDVFGPVMQPGSSSHTAGPCRLGLLAGDLVGESLKRVRIELDANGSYAGTFGIMAEDRAMVAGVLGIGPDDARLFSSHELAAEAGVEVSFAFTRIAESAHPNAIKFVLTGRDGLMVELVGNSTGGGMVETVLVDGFPVRVIGDSFVLLVQDPQEGLTADDLQRLRVKLPQVLWAHEARAAGRGVMHVYALAAEPDLDVARAALGAAAGPCRLSMLWPHLPVLDRTDHMPQLFDTMTGWRDLAEERDLPLWEVAVQYEVDASGWTRAQVVQRMRELAGLMRRQTRAVYEEDVAGSASQFKPDFAGRWKLHQGMPEQLTDGITAQTIRYAYGAGAGVPGVVNVPGPMGGGGGYVYAALSAVQEAHGFADEALLRGLFVAAGVGVIAYTRTEPTGEVIGCTGEAGVCGAMAAAGIVAMAGGPPAAAEDAASLALQAFTGMPCDPIPGGLGQPCRSRVMAATCMAHVFADMALAGHRAVLPLHEAIEVADRVGRALPPDLKCTSKGGACTAPSAKRCRVEYELWFDQTAPQDRPPGNLI